MQSERNDTDTGEADEAEDAVGDWGKAKPTERYFCS